LGSYLTAIMTLREIIPKIGNNIGEGASKINGDLKTPRKVPKSMQQNSLSTERRPYLFYCILLDVFVSDFIRQDIKYTIAEL